MSCSIGWYLRRRWVWPLNPLAPRVMPWKPCQRLTTRCLSGRPRASQYWRASSSSPRPLRADAGRLGSHQLPASSLVDPDLKDLRLAHGGRPLQRVELRSADHGYPAKHLDPQVAPRGGAWLRADVLDIRGLV